MSEKMVGNSPEEWQQMCQIPDLDYFPKVQWTVLHEYP